MPRKTRSTKSRVVPVRVKIAIGTLLVLGVAGVLLVRFLQSPRGNVCLLDLGFSDRYEAVQDAIDGELGAALDDLGLEKTLQESTSPTRVGTRTFYRRDWNVTLSKPGSLVRVNLALADASHRAGGVARSSRETPGGAGLVVEVGSGKHTTHLIRVARTPIGAPEPRRPAHPCRVALVIDDFGYSKNDVVERFFDMEAPLTVAVIPALPYSEYCVRRAVEKGKQAILHLPMEAESFISEVPPVSTLMSGAEIASLVERYLDETPGVIGVNNHLGSVATQDARVMESVLGVLRPRRLFFFDSLTSSKSVAYNTARSVGVPTAQNDLFVDTDTEDREVVAGRLERLSEIAKRRGYAIGIGHPRPWTYRAIEAYRGRVADQGVELVFLSDLLE